MCNLDHRADLDAHVSIIAAALARMPKLRGLILKNHAVAKLDLLLFRLSFEGAFVHAKINLK
jgi:hypothetical protein